MNLREFCKSAVSQSAAELHWRCSNDCDVSPQDFHESLHSLLLWLAHADSRRYAVDISHPDTPVEALQQHRSTLTVGG